MYIYIGNLPINICVLWQSRGPTYRQRPSGLEHVTIKHTHHMLMNLVAERHIWINNFNHGESSIFKS